MDAALAELLVSVTEGEVYKGYGGRGMCGKTTIGVVVESPEQALADVLQAVADGMLERGDFDMLLPVRGFRSDSMGRQTILY